MNRELDKLIPHRPPMRMIDALVSCGPDSAVGVRTSAADGYAATGNRVEEPALIEALAQTVAALHGAQPGAENAPPARGVLVGISDFEFPRPAAVGRELRLEVHIEKRLGPLCLVSAYALQDGVVVAQGLLKFHIGTPE